MRRDGQWPLHAAGLMVRGPRDGDRMAGRTVPQAGGGGARQRPEVGENRACWRAARSSHGAGGLQDPTGTDIQRTRTTCRGVPGHSGRRDETTDRWLTNSSSSHGARGWMSIRVTACSGRAFFGVSDVSSSRGRRGEDTDPPREVPPPRPTQPPEARCRVWFRARHA